MFSLIFFLGLKFRAYDRAAIKFRGVDADINFNLADYEEDINQVNYAVYVLIHGSIIAVKPSLGLRGPPETPRITRNK